MVKSKIVRRKKPYRFDLITLFPEECLSYARASILGRAQKNSLIKVNACNPRDFTDDVHKTVDARPYGGGPGMVMMVSPIFKALKSLRVKPSSRTRVILMSTRGKQFTGEDARRYASSYDRLVLISGRYEGVDERVAKQIADEEVSIGNFVLAGGELPSLVILEAVSRQLPGVLHTYESLEEEKGSYPVYTRPQIFKAKKELWEVPSVLLSGHAAKIHNWRRRFNKET